MDGLSGSLGVQELNGTEGVDGQADTASVVPAGEPASAIDTQTGKEPSGEGLHDGMTPEQVLKSYKELQREFTKRNEYSKSIEEKFSKYGGVEQVAQWTEFLSSNPRFSEWLNAEKERSAFGVPTSEMDEDTRKALDLVNRIAEQKVQEAMKSRVDPLADEYKQRIIKENIGEMDKKYGSDWREVQDVMAELAEHLPLEVQDKPKLADFEDLFFRALRQSGKLDGYMAKVYQRKLSEKQKLSTDKPPMATTNVSLKKPSNIREAFEAAKRQHGV